MTKLSFRIYDFKYKFLKRFGGRIRKYLGIPVTENIPSRMLISNHDASDRIYEAIKSGHPFMVARMGGVEQRLIMNCLALQFGLVPDIKKENLLKLIQNAGFFLQENTNDSVNDVNYSCEHFSELCLNALNDCDIYVLWNNYGDEYIIKNYLKKNGCLCNPEILEPWYDAKEPWSRALEGKNVLFIHPLAELMLSQYKYRDKLFPGTNILPSFNLKCLKAVQTIAGNRDPRFKDWFEALDWMHTEAQKIEYDVAIIGCGAYGLPLAAMLKHDSKQAILMGGATQLFWGIKGKRWTDRPFFQKLFNEYWVFPDEADRPKNYEKIEQGCYW